ncbi:MAG: ATP-binding cassette domain-containing protein [Tannerella sp.]|jgi:ABC-2 type transport system ATP-binding protein|nr:ATP-binding cassette domain-containing protein [Tannerella sp.]
MIHIEDLKFCYGKRARLFDGLSLTMESGHIYGLLGRNGAGKTTLLKIMTGMLFPEKGTCRMMSFESRKRNPSMLCDVIFVPEEFYAPSVSIGCYADLYAPYYPKFDMTQFGVCLDEMQLHKSDHLHSLSLGQKKKAVLAFALAAHTRVLILDEPTNGLDIPSKTQFRRMVAATATDDRCIIISTHQVRDVDKLIDTVIILDDSRIALHQGVGEIAAKLTFGAAFELTGNEVYYEEAISGYQVVKPCDDRTTPVNLELLFNAVMANKPAFEQMFHA